MNESGYPENYALNCLYRINTWLYIVSLKVCFVWSHFDKNKSQARITADFHGKIFFKKADNRYIIHIFFHAIDLEESEWRCEEIVNFNDVHYKVKYCSKYCWSTKLRVRIFRKSFQNLCRHEYMYFSLGRCPFV